MIPLQREWERINQLRDNVFAARTLPDRFAAVLELQGELHGFFHDFRIELDRLITGVPAPRPRIVPVPKERAA